MACREATHHDEDVATHAPRTLEYWVQIPRDSPRTRSCRTWVPASPAAYENPGRRAVLRRPSNTVCGAPAPAPAPAPVAAPALVSRPLWLCCRATGCLDSVVRRRKLSPARFTISADPAPPTVAARTVAGCTSISGAKLHLPHNVAQCSSSTYWTTTIPKRRACWNAQPQHGRGETMHEGDAVCVVAGGQGSSYISSDVRNGFGAQDQVDTRCSEAFHDLFDVSCCEQERFPVLRVGTAVKISEVARPAANHSSHTRPAPHRQRSAPPAASSLHLGPAASLSWRDASRCESRHAHTRITADDRAGRALTTAPQQSGMATGQPSP